MPLFANSQAKTNSSSPDSNRKLALVLSGGGPRGAMQVGALRALMEEGIKPDFMVGTSIGAINGAFLARYGYSLDTLDLMIDVWDSSARGNFAPGDFALTLLRSLLPGVKRAGYLQQARDFYSAHGITPDLQFRDLAGPKLYIVTADIQHFRPVIFGDNPDDLVLDSMLASATIPPWMPPLAMGESLLVDGGAVSDVPIEPALRRGATEIIALDLFHPRPSASGSRGVTGLLGQVFSTMENRHIELEMELAALMGVPVHRWRLQYEHPIPLWDLSHTHNLIHVGYEQAKTYLAEARKQQEQAAADRENDSSSSIWSWQELGDKLRSLLGQEHRDS